MAFEHDVAQAELFAGLAATTESGAPSETPEPTEPPDGALGRVIPIQAEEALTPPQLPAPDAPAAPYPVHLPFSEELPLAAAAHRAIDRLMEQGHPCVGAFSSGKDSSVLANLVLTTAASRRAAGLDVPPVLIIHSNTGVENPEVRVLADGEIAKIRKFAAEHDLPVEVRVGQPLLYTSWPVRVLSGRALPSFASSSRDCSTEWKVKVSRRLMVDAFKDLGAPKGAARAGKPAPVVMTGVRREESAARAAAINERGELADAIWQDESGRSYMSPILNWTADDVWEYLGYAAAGAVPAYSDFAETMQFYRDAGGSACTVIGDMKMAEQAAKQRGGCGARSGCWTCVRVQKDTSLEQMISSDPGRYGYMKRLNELRDFIARTQYDWSRRNFIGRSIDAEGFIHIQADAYSPDMLEELLHYTLSVQVLENMRAMREDRQPRFQIIGPRELIGIDALWSLYGLHRPFHVFEIMRRVEGGDLRFAPGPDVVPAAPHAPVPRLGKLFVGTDWDSELLTGDPRRDRLISGGIRDDMLGLFSEACGAGGLVRTPKGELVTNWETAESFEVDEEAAADFIGCGMADEECRRHHDDPRSEATTAIKKYLRMGLVMPVDGGVASWHRIAKRTDFLERHGLTGQVAIERLQQMLDAQAAGEPVRPLDDDQDPDDDWRAERMRA